VDAHRDELAAPWEAVGGQQDEQTWELMTAVRAVTGAAWQVAQAGTAADVEQATGLLTEVRRRLYGILAGSSGGTAEDGADDSPEPADDAEA
jgi:hypothetical protein